MEYLKLKGGRVIGEGMSSYCAKVALPFCNRCPRSLRGAGHLFLTFVFEVPILNKIGGGLGLREVVGGREFKGVESMIGEMGSGTDTGSTSKVVGGCSL